MFLHEIDQVQFMWIFEICEDMINGGIYCSENGNSFCKLDISDC